MKRLLRACVASCVLTACLASCAVDEERLRPIYFAERIGGEGAAWQVMALESDGGVARQLTATVGVDNDEIDVSPDGTLVAFASGRDLPAPVDGQAQNATPRLVYLMNSDGSGQRRLTANSPTRCSEHTPRFSPDGRWIVFAMSCDDVAPADISRLYRVRIDGSEHEALRPNHPELAADGSRVSPAFDATGTRVLFVGELAQAPANYELWSLDLADGTTRRLTRCADAGRSVVLRNRLTVWSGAAYFVSDDGRGAAAAFESVAVDAGAAQQRRFEIPPVTASEALQGLASYFGLALAFDDGRALAVTYDDYTVDPPAEALVVLNADGSPRVTMRSGGRYSGPVW